MEVCEIYPQIQSKIKEEVYFITTQELEDKYPDLTGQEREDAITKEHGTVFLMQIGDKLKSGEPHDGRAPDYDDWQLNGDILIWNSTLNSALEVSSMGIRVDSESLLRQLAARKAEDRMQFEYHMNIANNVYPLTLGGGIGQSRICMLLLEKAHIGEVQCSIWSADMRECQSKQGIILL
jgi:aspartate--ammonia ligase